MLPMSVTAACAPAAPLLSSLQQLPSACPPAGGSAVLLPWPWHAGPLCSCACAPAEGRASSAGRARSAGRASSARACASSAASASHSRPPVSAQLRAACGSAPCSPAAWAPAVLLVLGCPYWLLCSKLLNHQHTSQCCRSFSPTTPPPNHTRLLCALATQCAARTVLPLFCPSIIASMISCR